eukprot:5098583-Alexandrium_andersonii.AAC.1
MSASLVGSEMCIRDSVCAARPSPRRARAHESTFAYAGAGAPPPRPRGPVSYTHLTLPTICSV